MKTILKTNWFSLLLISGVTLYGVVCYENLPAQMATRFNWGGEPHQYIDKFFAVSLLPFILFGVVLFVPLLIRISLRGYQMDQSIGSVARLNFSVSVSIGVLYVGLLHFNLNPNAGSIIPYLHATCTLFLLSFGNFLSKIEKNFLIGVRTPWTLISERNWFSTHRFAAKASVFGGGLLLLLIPFRSHLGWTLTIFIVSLFVPFTYSYWFHRYREPKENGGPKFKDLAGEGLYPPTKSRR